MLGGRVGLQWEGYRDKGADGVTVSEGRMEDGRMLRQLGLWVSTNGGN